MPAFAATADGTRIAIRVQPRASRTEITGLHGDALRIRIAAPPVDGAANDALVRFLADRLGVSRAALAVTVGHTGRSKTVMVSGLSPVEVAAKLLGA